MGLISDQKLFAVAVCSKLGGLLTCSALGEDGDQG
jgi:hypothetical protein